MELTAENYFSEEASKEYMSVSQYKQFAGTAGIRGCEFQAMEELNGRWEHKMTKPMLVGSYVDAWFEGTLDSFRKEHPEIFKKDGTLLAEFKGAEYIIERVKRDPLFMEFMSGEKQRIMEGELFGVKWKIKMDSYIPGVCITDLKVMQSITKTEWTKDLGKLEFVRYWGYDIQGAIYQEIVRQNTGEKLPFYIAAVSKEEEPDIEVIHVTDNFLADALSIVRSNMPRVLAVKNGEMKPDRCEECNCCRKSKVLTAPITLLDLQEPIARKGAV